MPMPDGPIHVDFIAPAAHGLPGRLGLTIAPGKWRQGLDSASDTLVREDLLSLRDVHGAKVLVTLLEEFEMKRLAIPELLGVARHVGLRSLWFPIADVSVPSDLEETSSLVDGIVERMSRGETVVVHCLAGRGRSGTVAACCLVATGRAPSEAIRMVRRVRPGAVEVETQVEFVKRFARGRAGGHR